MDIIGPEREKRLSMDDYMSDSYFHPDQWMSMRAQVALIHEVNPKNVLEVGAGNGMVTALLRHCGYEVTTLDINQNLRPDKVGNVEDVGHLFPHDRFDAVLCAEVLEHLPFEALPRCLEGMHRVTRRWVIITLPRSVRVLLFARGRLPKGFEYDICLYLPTQWDSDTSGVHYWAIDSSRNTRMRSIVEQISRFFAVRRYGRIQGHPLHYYFLLEKTN